MLDTQYDTQNKWSEYSFQIYTKLIERLLNVLKTDIRKP